MADSVYKIIELVGTSTESWEKAAKAAVDRASKSLRDLRIAEVSQLDMHMKDGKIEAYRAKVKVSFKYEGEELRPFACRRLFRTWRPPRAIGPPEPAPNRWKRMPALPF